MDLSCIEWEVLGLQGGDELHSLKVGVDWEEIPEVAHVVPEVHIMEEEGHDSESR